MLFLLSLDEHYTYNSYIRDNDQEFPDTLDRGGRAWTFSGYGHVNRDVLTSLTTISSTLHITVGLCRESS